MKSVCIAVLLFLVMVTTVIADQSISAVSSGVLSSSQAVVARSVRLTDLAVYTDGTNNVTVTLYDNATAASGTVIGKVIVLGASYNGGLFIPIPIKAVNGIYCSISGTGGTAIVFYDPQ